MTDSHAPAIGRNLLPMAALCASLALAACQTGGPVATSGGASASGVSYLTEIRTSHGLPPLAYDARLEQAALQQAAYMARSGRMEHTTGWGKDFARRMKSNGVDAPAAENIAVGQDSAAAAFEAWYRSPKHLENMLGAGYRGLGVAVVSNPASGGLPYWAMVLSS